ncbi:MAG: hypothetical protein BWY54_00488 [Candidatus Dependentiae bacterium ADurb.Bin331]|nr:MAG: hypothetical protein BWY54_00488 [Candidatus Dependentiae bacterium ADurb.Bin331]
MKLLTRLFLPILILMGTFSHLHCDTNLSSGTQWGMSTFVPSFLMWPTVGDISVATLNYGYNTVQSFAQNPKIAWSITAAALVGAGFSWWKTKKCEADMRDIKLRYASSAVVVGKKLSVVAAENSALKKENQMFKASVIDMTNKLPINEDLLKRFENPMLNWRIYRD